MSCPGRRPKMNEKNKLAYLVLILVMLVVTAYLTTAYIVKFWPFSSPTASKPKIDLTPIAENVQDKAKTPDKPDLSKGVVGNDKDKYEISDGTMFDCGSFSFAFPKGWLRLVMDGGKNVVSTDVVDATNSIMIKEIQDFILTKENAQETIDQLKKALAQDYVIEQAEVSEFMGRNCVIMSGSTDWNGTKAGLLIIALPDEKGPDYLVIGLYNPLSDEAKQTVTNAMVTLTPDTF
jgi:hypothetical protein